MPPDVAFTPYVRRTFVPVTSCCLPLPRHGRAHMPPVTQTRRLFRCPLTRCRILVFFARCRLRHFLLYATVYAVALPRTTFCAFTFVAAWVMRFCAHTGRTFVPGLLPSAGSPVAFGCRLYWRFAILFLEHWCRIPVWTLLLPPHRCATDAAFRVLVLERGSACTPRRANNLTYRYGWPEHFTRYGTPAFRRAPAFCLRFTYRITPRTSRLPPLPPRLPHAQPVACLPGPALVNGCPACLTLRFTPVYVYLAPTRVVPFRCCPDGLRVAGRGATFFGFPGSLHMDMNIARRGHLFYAPACDKPSQFEPLVSFALLR